MKEIPIILKIVLVGFRETLTMLVDNQEIILFISISTKRTRFDQSLKPKEIVTHRKMQNCI